MSAERSDRVFQENFQDNFLAFFPCKTDFYGLVYNKIFIHLSGCSSDRNALFTSTSDKIIGNSDFFPLQNRFLQFNI